MGKNKVRASGFKNVLKSYTVKVKAGSVEKHACVTKAIIAKPVEAKTEAYLGAHKIAFGKRIGGAGRVIRFRPDNHA